MVVLFFISINKGVMQNQIFGRFVIKHRLVDEVGKIFLDVLAIVSKIRCVFLGVFVEQARLFVLGQHNACVGLHRQHAKIVRHKCLALSDDLQGQHLGRELVSFALDEARACGKGGLLLTTHVANLRGQALYEAMGFVCMGQCKNGTELFYLYRYRD